MGNKNIKRAIAYLGLAICCAFIAFYALFAGGINHYVAIGVMILGFLGFGIFFGKAFDRWSARREQEPTLAPSSGSES